MGRAEWIERSRLQKRVRLLESFIAELQRDMSMELGQIEPDLPLLSIAAAYAFSQLATISIRKPKEPPRRLFERRAVMASQ